MILNERFYLQHFQRLQIYLNFLSKTSKITHRFLRNKILDIIY